MSLTDAFDSGIADYLFSLLAGAGLGLFFFLGLWWTVRQLASSRHVAMLFLVSMLFRSGVVVLGFYFILGDNWIKLTLGLLGFIAVRLLATRHIGKLTVAESQINRADYAP